MRQVHTTKTAMDFFNEQGLNMNGLGCTTKDKWFLAITKELIDNALGAIEKKEKKAREAGEVVVTLSQDFISVQDNAGGMTKEAIQHSYDFERNSGENAGYRGITRGQLGNAYKTVYAAPLVASNSNQSVIEIDSAIAGHYNLITTVNRTKEEAVTTSEGPVKTTLKQGTKVTVHWPGVGADGNAVIRLNNLLFDYYFFNPHITFKLYNEDALHHKLEAQNQKWSKWANATSAHWYDSEDLEKLIVMEYIKSGREKTLADFIATFDGLKRSARQKEVKRKIDFKATYLHELINGDGNPDKQKVAALLTAMQSVAKEVDAKEFGILGKKKLKDSLECCGVSEMQAGKDWYQCVTGRTSKGTPYLIEAGFGVRDEENDSSCITYGLNFSPTLSSFSDALSEWLTYYAAPNKYPVALVVNLVCPKLQLKDKSKGSIVEDRALSSSVFSAVEAMTKQFFTAKKKADNGKLVSREEMRGKRSRGNVFIKDACYAEMETGYRKAAGLYNVTTKRQIFYVVRDPVCKRTGKPLEWQTFCKAVDDFREDRPELTKDWNIDIDARGKAVEPHTNKPTPLGTAEVRKYLSGWINDNDELDISINEFYPTSGPANRFKFALFVEKEGFNSLLEMSGISKRYDIMIISTKGNSVIASRQLLDQLSQAGVTTLIAHDFDTYGKQIEYTFREDSKRYAFEEKPNVIDIGLSLREAQEMGLQHEEISIEKQKDPREKLEEYGATKDEIDFLVQEQRGNVWAGRRIELNAMTSDQFIGWLEGNFAEHGVTKVIPDANTLEAAWNRALKVAKIKEAIAKVQSESVENPMPVDLSDRVSALLKEKPELSWDMALVELMAVMEESNA